MSTPAGIAPPPQLPTVLAKVRPPKGAKSKTTICTLAMVLISAATANMVYGMQGGAVDLPRAAWTLLGLITGSGLVYLGSCADALTKE